MLYEAGFSPEVETHAKPCSRVRVLMITGAFYPKMDGSVIAAGNLVEELVKRGNQVTVLTRSYSNEDSDRWKGIEVARVPQHGFSLVARFILAIDLVRKGLSLMKRERFDLIHAHGFSSLLVAETLRLFRRVPVVVTFHGLQRLWNRDWSAQWLLKFVFLLPFEGAMVRRSDLVVAQSGRLKSILTQLYKIRPTRILVLPNPVDLNVFSFHPPVSRSRVVLFVGTMGQLYSPDVLVRASVRILSQVPDARFVFVGAGPSERGVRELAKSLGVEDHVQLVGRISDRRVLESYYRSSRVLVIPFSGRGGYILSLAAIESMAVGRPVIITYEIDSVPGVIRSTMEPAELAKQITNVLSLSEDEYDRLSREARTSVERLGGREVAEKLESAYLDLTSHDVGSDQTRARTLNDEIKNSA